MGANISPVLERALCEHFVQVGAFFKASPERETCAWFFWRSFALIVWQRESYFAVGGLGRSVLKRVKRKEPEGEIEPWPKFWWPK